MIGIFGDSIASGLGAGRESASYSRIVAAKCGVDLADFSASARKVDESLRLLLESGVRPDVAIIGQGVTEAIVRPSERMLRSMPARWRRTGWMDPRPYYSASRAKRIPQRLESEVRWRMKVALMRGGTEQLMSRSEFEVTFRAMLAELSRRGSRIVVLGPPDVDTRYFPYSMDALREYADVSAAVGAEFDAAVVPVFGQLVHWTDYCDDHLHPNAVGHMRIAGLLSPPVGELLSVAGR
ncbi:hypothetical protein G6038_19950 [Rhodococcus sp. 14C212]|nr:GDSL-type esterase/lipase family protein [Rhodococcus sp. 14C212]NGP07713.1 hypothetical protein [Rhodococcus sp. 14C212]